MSTGMFITSEQQTFIMTISFCELVSRNTVGEKSRDFSVMSHCFKDCLNC